MAHYKGAASEAGRAMHLMKKREKEKEKLEQLKQKIEQDNFAKIDTISSKFSSHYDAVEQQLKTETVGLVTLTEMKAKRDDLVKEREKELAKAAPHVLKAAEKRKKEKQKQKYKSALSFDVDEDEDDCSDDDDDDEEKEEPVVFKKKKLGKNPDVDTSFLPDRDREEEENKLREVLRQEWVAKQEKLKNEDVEITFSYWDGSGHRRSVQMKKGSTIQYFLQKAVEMLRKDFHELKSATVENLMYIKEDLIIPHHYSFYDFIVTKARGKSGPLFSFDVHDDIRLINDATVEKDESHAGKVVLRSWYERNKHIFPASRWEPYDPEKKWDKYTISDGRGKL
ncbi:protein FAM50A-like [Ptychodera flava]|uniref:protein FAM50A-like n=1 Tax=Ptychodera flava TaxID=63121 RepID=UPI00396A1CAD